MSLTAPWVAGGVRARLLLRRSLGVDGARAVAAAGSLDPATRLLASTSYGRDVRAGMDLVTAERAVAATLLWHLRVLAGWLPASGGRMARTLAGWYEMHNIEDRVLLLRNGEPRAPFAMGSLGTAWARVAHASTAEEVRSALRGSPWGDPGSSDPEAIHLALRLAWARRVGTDVSEAAAWADAAAVLTVARELAAGRDTLDRMGSAVPYRLRGASSLTELAGRLPRAMSWVLDGVTDSAGVWSAEARWWRRVESEAMRLVSRANVGRAPVVGTVALLGADAHRVRAALVLAARGGTAEAADAVA
jgi:hypothetical protein